MRRRAVISGMGVAAGAAVLPAALVSPAFRATQASASEAQSAGAGFASNGASDNDRDRRRPARPLVIGHRGASGHRPEHTLGSYTLAIELGADFIEPDLVPTKDGQLVARHENEIGGTTDVSTKPQFASRKTTKTVDGVAVTGWFTEDFTLAELKTLRAVERLPAVRPHNTIYNGIFQIPTFQEVIDLAREAGKRVGRTIGVYPETKHPTYFNSIGLALEPLVAKVLKRNGLAGRNAAAFLQSFEPTSIKKLRGLVDTPAVVLLDQVGLPFDFKTSGDPRTWADLAKPAGLDYLKAFADGVGATKNLVIARDAAGNLLQPTALIHDAHARGLKVHSWTFRNENQFLPLNLRVGDDPNAWGNIIEEVRTFLAAGLDGVFADYADTAFLARDLYLQSPGR
ncbi:glycerophosphodiester phosphodiesterase [Dactylosporangium sp. NPDC051541]|uniref:glycerophosphodiester phosphodiesterase n=1 Tax=Dactylosporangium sp. NPDC051541 TaxID=3363977 RepID=UPI0037A60B2A